MRQPLGTIYFGPLTGLCHPTCNCEFLGRDCLTHLCSQYLMCCLELTSYDPKQNKNQFVKHTPDGREGEMVWHLLTPNALCGAEPAFGMLCTSQPEQFEKS